MRFITNATVYETQMYNAAFTRLFPYTESIKFPTLTPISFFKIHTNITPQSVPVFL